MHKWTPFPRPTGAFSWGRIRSGRQRRKCKKGVRKGFTFCEMANYSVSKSSRTFYSFYQVGWFLTNSLVLSIQPTELSKLCPSALWACWPKAPLDFSKQRTPATACSPASVWPPCNLHPVWLFLLHRCSSSSSYLSLARSLHKWDTGVAKTGMWPDLSPEWFFCFFFPISNVLRKHVNLSVLGCGTTSPSIHRPITLYFLKPAVSQIPCR